MNSDELIWSDLRQPPQDPQRKELIEFSRGFLNEMSPGLSKAVLRVDLRLTAPFFSIAPFFSSRKWRETAYYYIILLWFFDRKATDYTRYFLFNWNSVFFIFLYLCIIKATVLVIIEINVIVYFNETHKTLKLSVSVKEFPYCSHSNNADYEMNFLLEKLHKLLRIKMNKHQLKQI